MHRRGTTELVLDAGERRLHVRLEDDGHDLARYHLADLKAA
jgi:hypothetical protein